MPGGAPGLPPKAQPDDLAFSAPEVGSRDGPFPEFRCVLFEG